MECQYQLHIAEQKLAVLENISIDIETDKVPYFLKVIIVGYWASQLEFYMVEINVLIYAVGFCDWNQISLFFDKNDLSLPCFISSAKILQIPDAETLKKLQDDNAAMQAKISELKFELEIKKVRSCTFNGLFMIS